MAGPSAGIRRSWKSELVHKPPQMRCRSPAPRTFGARSGRLKETLRLYCDQVENIAMQKLTPSQRFAFVERFRDELLEELARI